MSKKFTGSAKSLCIALIGDEATVTGMLLTGMGERNKKGETNFLIVGKDTTLGQIETAFKTYIEREDIGIILISQNIAEMIRNLVAEYEGVVPTILEIPSKDVPYEAEKDTILIKAARILYGSDAAEAKLREP
jgi:V-type H+-transporting ATPase subunit F